MKPKASQIIVFLIDGWGVYYLNAKDTPFWYQNTVRTLKNVIPTITGPNWASILSGKSPKQHKILKNEQLSYYRKSARYPFHTLCDDFPNTVLISDWKRMSLFTSGHFYHTRKVLADFPQIYQKHKDADLFILNLDRVDSIAHTKGWGSEPFYRVVRRLDAQMESIYRFLLTQKKSFVLLGLADHGGYEKDHDLEEECKVADHRSHQTDHDLKKCDTIRKVPLLLLQHSVQKRSFKWPPPRIRKTTSFRPWLLQNVRATS